MKNLLKKCFSILAMTSLLTSQIYVSGLADDTTTSAAYTINNDLDADGNWIYRELVPDIECETTNGFLKIGKKTPGSTMQDDDIVLSNTNPHGGNYSIKRTMRTNPGIAFTPTAALKTYTQDEPNEYVISAWMRTECGGGQTVKVVPGYTIPAQTPFGKGTGESSIGFEVKNTWQYFSKKVQKKESDAANSVGFWFYGNTLTAANAVYDTTGTESKYIQTLYIDDWSMRLCVPYDFPETKRLSVDYNEESQTLTYKFNLDIDPRTVRKENIDVNGVRGGTYIESAILKTTNEETREHTLTLKLQNFEKENIITVKLADIKDAWGRDVSGNAPFIINNYPEGQYTIYDDLDDGGLWKYRELVPNVGCETKDGFAAVGKPSPADSTIQDADIVLSTDKHSGNYSIKRTMRQNMGIGFVVPKEAVVAGDPYIVSAYLKTGTEKGGYDKPITVSINNEEGGFVAAIAGGRSSFDVTTDWKYHSTTLKFNSAFTKDTNQVFLLWNTLTLTTGGVQDSSVSTATPVQTLYVDDWSFRKIPTFDVYQTGAYVDNTSAEPSVKFVFDKDIDSRSVDISNVMIDGAATDKVKSFTVVTDEITRESVLTLNLNGEIPRNSSVSISHLKDAWGRDIKNTFGTGLSLGTAKITAADGTEIMEETPLGAGEYTYTVSGITNGTANTADISAILALFDSDKKFVKAALDSKSFAMGSTGGELCAKLTVSENAAGCTLRSFIWNTKTLTPYTNR